MKIPRKGGCCSVNIEVMHLQEHMQWLHTGGDRPAAERVQVIVVSSSADVIKVQPAKPRGTIELVKGLISWRLNINNFEGLSASSKPSPPEFCTV